MAKKAVVLLSGGFVSMTMLALASGETKAVSYMFGKIRFPLSHRERMFA